MGISNSKIHIIDDLVDILKKDAIGKSNAIHSKDLLDRLFFRTKIAIGERQLVELINMIRTNWKIKNLVAGYDGYFIANNKSETEDYLSMLNKRIDSTQIIINSFDNGELLDHGNIKKEKYNNDW